VLGIQRFEIMIEKFAGNSRIKRLLGKMRLLQQGGGDKGDFSIRRAGGHMIRRHRLVGIGGRRETVARSGTGRLNIGETGKTSEQPKTRSRLLEINRSIMI